MATPGSCSPFSPSGFPLLETETGLAEDDNQDVVDECVSSIEDAGYLQILLEKERDQCNIGSHVNDSVKAARSEAIQSIIKTRAFLQFQFHTAYLSVTYIDRFLSKICIENDKDWAIRLLSVACLSLAAKVKEKKPAPPLSYFPTDGYVFESSVIQRMELLVSTTLDWRMHSITPFDFIRFFISCFCKESPKRHFVSVTTQILFATIKDVNVMAHRSSTKAVAATLMAMDQNLTRESLQMKLKATWLNPLLDHEDVHTCYCRMLEHEQVKIIFRLDLINNSKNTSGSTKRKRLTFESNEKEPNQ